MYKLLVRASRQETCQMSPVYSCHFLILTFYMFRKDHTGNIPPNHWLLLFSFDRSGQQAAEVLVVGKNGKL